MRIKTRVALGYQCPACGNIQEKELQLFDFSKDKTLEVLCDSCHRKFATIEKTGKYKFTITASCIDCYDNHCFRFGLGEVWRSRLKEFRCTQSSEVIFALGDGEAVGELLKEIYYEIEDYDSDGDLSEMLADLFLQGDRPRALEVVEKITEAIHHVEELSMQGKISCACGEVYIQLKIAEDKIQLVCPNCGREKTVDISTEEKIEDVSQIKNIKLI